MCGLVNNDFVLIKYCNTGVDYVVLLLCCGMKTM